MSGLHSVYGIGNLPSDNSLRKMIDGNADGLLPARRAHGKNGEPGYRGRSLTLPLAKTYT